MAPNLNIGEILGHGEFNQIVTQMRNDSLNLDDMTKYYNCGKKGHFQKNCWFKKKSAEDCSKDEIDFDEPPKQSNMGIEEVAASSVVIEKSETALIVVSNRRAINYKDDWIVDSGCSNHMTGDKEKLSRCSNHMTGDKEKLSSLSAYRGDRVVIMANNSRLPITHIGKTVINPQFSPNEIKLEDVYHVPGMKKNLLSVSQLTTSSNYVVFGPKDVKVYRSLKPIGTPIMKGQRLESIYIMTTKTAYVDKTRKNETADLWHAHLGHSTSIAVCGVKVQSKRTLGACSLDVFGGVKQALISDHLRSKFDKKAIRCIFVGYNNERKG
ncbi:hypothetical protein Acr_00g0058830 [Actinidia rufa]|uniref:CCHC-type domain-containing protein n=1 Tax=Actinidia rufa TaxID=165716 RepID=A0A7J0DPZ6_9ERIC|nr:hypothetical protein Acr_00g0058830 [Actinidia rufa]